jgi:hypothetical protein
LSSQQFFVNTKKSISVNNQDPIPLKAILDDTEKAKAVYGETLIDDNS